MPHDYNTRTIANLETKLLDGFLSFKDEVINLKDVVIRNLKEENAKLRSSVKVLENKFNHLEQYGIHNNIKASRTTDLIGENVLHLWSRSNFLLSMLLLSGDVEMNPGHKSHSKEHFSICHWNLNSPYLY